MESRCMLSDGSGGAGVWHEPVPAGGALVVTAGPSGNPQAAAKTVQRSATHTILGASDNFAPAGQTLTFTVQVTESQSGNKEPGGRVVFKDGSKVLGTAMLSDGKARFVARLAGEGFHTIRAEYKGDGDHAGSRSQAIRALIVRPVDVDLLAVYTPKVAATEQGADKAVERIRKAVANTNRALWASHVATVIRLARAQEMQYKESGDLNKDLRRLAGEDDGYMDAVHQARDRYGADLVCLFVASGNVGGLAYQLTDLYADHNDRLGFSVVRADVAGAPDYTLAHELGHNLGATHDAQNADGPGATAFSHGYRFRANGKVYRDIMSYAPGKLVPYFSNPAIFYAGVPTGTADTADSALTITLTSPFVAAYRKR